MAQGVCCICQPGGSHLGQPVCLATQHACQLLHHELVLLTLTCSLLHASTLLSCCQLLLSERVCTLHLCVALGLQQSLLLLKCS
jgi:hypothetical protein